MLAMADVMHGALDRRVRVTLCRQESLMLPTFRSRRGAARAWFRGRLARNLLRSVVSPAVGEWPVCGTSYDATLKQWSKRSRGHA